MTMLLKELKSYDDFEALEPLQQAIWQFEPMAVTPRHVFIAAARSGGLVLGAFDDQNNLAGFALSFRGERDQTPCLYSHLMGVLPTLQNQGIGYELKMAQRAFALENGLDSIVWTFDPMMARNACLNIQKLGGKIYRYIPNAYGSSDFKMYGDGFPTHRFELHWHVNAIPSSTSSWALEERETLITLNDAGEPTIEHAVLEGAKDKSVLLPIPGNHLEMRQSNPGLAHRWQDSVVACASTLLESSHRIESFQGDLKKGSYLLVPKNS